MNANEILNNIETVRRRIISACKKSGRNPDSVRLLLAVKTVEPEKIRVAVEAGETLIGENKIQEFAEKNSALSDLKYEKHFIGHLQTNKLKDIVKYEINCVQSLDRLELACKLDRRMQDVGRSIDVMVQVNTSFEKSKFGLEPDSVNPFLKKLKQYETLNVKGFMTIGLFDSDSENVRPSYTRLREIRDSAVSEGLVHAGCELSMGMSGDLETAIEEGATIIRVGSAIFGTRLYSNK
ncbi:MAG: YggS family pyridoxal phosphate-dependent enzyme [Prevotellaceae bacterium]|jgi:pyridoxal phosphate enzyme (YggS family)|nr:YggS family pyridoxal phosphate-dependent enzyme [Prevotellaceae bacterium]